MTHVEPDGNSHHPRKTRAESVLTPSHRAGHLPAETAARSTIFTIFEGTSEIQRMIIARALTGLDVR
jgi:alkylation response protein AidB-like acyl-CoA dehydrogenase